jgi:DNA-binding transcriptional MerR regulator
MASRPSAHGEAKTRRAPKASGVSKPKEQRSADRSPPIQEPLGTRGQVLDAFRAPEVCELAGISYRQLDYWSRTGLIKPGIKEASGSGTRRLYSFKDLILIKAIKGLIEAGMSLQKVREAIDYIRGAMTEDPSELTLIATEGTILIFGPGEEAQLIDALKGGQIALSLALGPLYDELQKSVSELEASKRRHPSVGTGGSSDLEGQLSLFGE